MIPSMEKKSRKITKNCMAQLLCNGVCTEKSGAVTAGPGVYIPTNSDENNKKIKIRGNIEAS